MGRNYYEQRGRYSDAELVACYQKHHSQIKAASELGVSRETVARAVRRAGISMTGRKLNGRNQLQAKATNAQIVECAQSGMTVEQIAARFDMSSGQVYRRIRRLGIDCSCVGYSSTWRHRAKRYGCESFDESITLEGVIKRDKGICQICGNPVVLTDILNGHVRRLYPTVDHIKAMSKGGAHTWDNVRLAHMCCNAGKCDRD